MIELFNKYSMYIFVLIGLLAGVPAVWKFRDKANLGPPGVALMCVVYSVCSVIAAMLFAQLESLIGSGKLGNSGAISTYGIYFFGPFLIMLISKVLKFPIAGTMDLFALYAMPSLFMMRCHCLISGCCYGLPIGDTGLQWPVRLTEMIFYTVMFLVLWKKLEKNESPGQLFPLLMIGYGLFRFVNQWFRDTGSDGWHMSHTWSVLCAFIGLSLLLEFRAQAAKAQRGKGKKPENRRNKK